MADINIKKINVGGTDYLIEDESAREALTGKQDKLTAGTNITIDENNVISATGGSAEHTDLDLPIDLSSYSENDVIPTTIITKLKEHRAHIKVLYGGIQYAISNITEDATGLEGIVLNGLDIADDSYLVKVLLIIKAAGSSDYKLDTVGGIDVATYIEGALTIKLDSENKFTLVTNNGVGINIYKNNSQADLIDLTLPATSGTLATTADATVTSQKVIDALGYTPYNKAAGGIPKSDLASDVQTSLSKADNAAEKATAVTNVAYDTTNKKLTKTINGTTSDVVTVAKIKTDLNLAKGDVGLGNVDNKSSATIRSEITSANVTDALGYTPYNSTNPSGYISGIDGTMVKTALGYTPYNATNPEGYISGITGPMVNSALGYVPYDSANPSGYISSYTVTQSDVTNALGYVPYNSTNPNNYISGISGTDVTTALGYVPYNSTNPNGYITGISSSDVTAALGYTPYNSSNPNNYIDATTNSLNNYYTKTAVDGMVANRFQAKIVQTLPASGISTSTIYMVLQTGQQNIYDEYMYIENTWVKIGTTLIDMSEYAKTADLHNVALTGAYSSLVGKPTIPANTSDLTNDSGFITNTANNLQNYTKTDDLAPVAITNSYNDLLNKPSVPTSTSQLTNDSGFLTNTNLSQTNISTFINNVPYATLNDVRGLEDIDVEEIKKAIAAMEHIGTVTQVTGGTGLTGSGNTTVTINHSNSVVANTSWPSGTSSPENGGKFNVRDVKYDTEGHVTSYQDREITLPFIPSYDDTTVRGLISDETAARTATDARVTALENFNVNTFTSFVFCIFGIEPYIDPETMQIVPNRYYQRSDVDTGIYMDNEKVDVHLKAWLKYHYNIDDLANLKNITCYVYAMGDHGEYVNHMVTFWSQRTNPKIMNYPHLQQVGSFIDDGYGSVRRFTATQIGAILSSTDDGYVQADPLGTGKGFVTGWSSLTDRVTAAETAITGKQDTLTAGTNISISGATISADDQVDVVSGTTPANSVQIWIDNSEHYAELDDPEIVQVPGQSTMKVMSQKAVTDEINNHTENSTIHVTAADKTNWNGKLNAQQSASDAGKALVVGADGTVSAKWYTHTHSQSEITDLGADLANKQNTLTAGTGINIINDTISCTVESGEVDLTDIEANISSLNNAVFDIHANRGTRESGKMYNYDSNAIQTFSGVCAVTTVPVITGCTYYATTSMRAASTCFPLVTYFAADNTRLGYEYMNPSDVEITIKDKRLNIPEGTAYFYLNSRYIAYDHVDIKTSKIENMLDEIYDYLPTSPVETIASKLWYYTGNTAASVSNGTIYKYLVDANTKYLVTSTVYGADSGFPIATFFDSNGNQISYQWMNEPNVTLSIVDQELIVPDNAAYVYINARGATATVKTYQSKLTNLNSKELKILFVGNSLTQDGIAYLPYMLKTYYPEIKFKIYMWYCGGFTLSQHYQYFVNNTSCDIFSIADNVATWTNTSKTMSEILSTYKFDIVSMQEYFNYQDTADLTVWNNCRDYITSNYTGGNALKFISLFHAPKRDNAEVIFNRTVAQNKIILSDTIAEDIIPNGVAVYRALSTALDSLGDQGHLSPDGTHTQEGLPCLLQTYVALLWVFETFGINKSIYGHPMRMTTAIYNTLNVPGPNLGTGVITGTDAENLLAQEVAIKAFKERRTFWN